MWPEGRTTDHHPSLWCDLLQGHVHNSKRKFFLRKVLLDRGFIFSQKRDVWIVVALQWQCRVLVMHTSNPPSLCIQTFPYQIQMLICLCSPGQINYWNSYSDHTIIYHWIVQPYFPYLPGDASVHYPKPLFKKIHFQEPWCHTNMLSPGPVKTLQACHTSCHS